MDALLEAVAVKICKDECPNYDPYEGFSPFRSGPRWKCFVDRARKQLAEPEMDKVIAAARAEGFKAGQEAMRERAAAACGGLEDAKLALARASREQRQAEYENDAKVAEECGDYIRALPIQEEA